MINGGWFKLGWEFLVDSTLNGSYSFDLWGYEGSKFAVLATHDIDDSSFIGVYGFGDTEDAAMNDARSKIKNIKFGQEKEI